MWNEQKGHLSGVAYTLSRRGRKQSGFHGNSEESFEHAFECVSEKGLLDVPIVDFLFQPFKNFRQLLVSDVPRYLLFADRMCTFVISEFCLWLP